MTKFTKENFGYHGGYLHYYIPNGNREFVGRFKHNARSESAAFKKFLITNFTVEEYFDRMAAKETPLAIMESKGYVMAHIKKWLRDAGLPETLKGRQMLLDRQRAAREAK